MADPEALRTAYLEEVDGFQRQIRRACHANRIDYVPLDTSESLGTTLSAYLSRATRAGGRVDGVPVLPRRTARGVPAPGAARRGRGGGGGPDRHPPAQPASRAPAAVGGDDVAPRGAQEAPAPAEDGELAHPRAAHGRPPPAGPRPVALDPVRLGVRGADAPEAQRRPAPRHLVQHRRQGGGARRVRPRPGGGRQGPVGARLRRQDRGRGEQRRPPRPVRGPPGGPRGPRGRARGRLPREGGAGRGPPDGGARPVGRRARGLLAAHAPPGPGLEPRPRLGDRPPGRRLARARLARRGRPAATGGRGAAARRASSSRSSTSAAPGRARSPTCAWRASRRPTRPTCSSATGSSSGVGVVNYGPRLVEGASLRVFLDDAPAPVRTFRVGPLRAGRRDHALDPRGDDPGRRPPRPGVHERGLARRAGRDRPARGRPGRRQPRPRQPPLPRARRPRAPARRRLDRARRPVALRPGGRAARDLRRRGRRRRVRVRGRCAARTRCGACSPTRRAPRAC